MVLGSSLIVTGVTAGERKRKRTTSGNSLGNEPGEESSALTAVITIAVTAIIGAMAKVNAGRIAPFIANTFFSYSFLFPSFPLLVKRTKIK
jgi:hypothetical protein